MTGWRPAPGGRKTSARSTTPSSIGMGGSHSILIARDARSARRRRLAHALDDVRRHEIDELGTRGFHQLDVAFDHLCRVHLADSNSLHELIHHGDVFGRRALAVEPRPWIVGHAIVEAGGVR